jgi:threonine dehydratase
MISRWVDDVVLVGEAAIKRAIRVGLLYGKLLLEGAGAASLAAVLEGLLDLKMKTVIIASGSNIDKQLFIDVINEKL